MPRSFPGGPNNVVPHAFLAAQKRCGSLSPEVCEADRDDTKWQTSRETSRDAWIEARFEDICDGAGQEDHDVPLTEDEDSCIDEENAGIRADDAHEGSYPRIPENGKKAEARRVSAFLAMLEGRFSDEDDKPGTFEELERLMPEYADEFARFKMLCKQQYGTTPARLLKSRGIISRHRVYQDAAPLGLDVSKKPETPATGGSGSIEVSAAGARDGSKALITVGTDDFGSLAMGVSRKGDVSSGKAQPRHEEGPAAEVSGVDQACPKSADAARSAEIDRVLARREELLWKIAELEGRPAREVQSLRDQLASLEKELSQCGVLDFTRRRALREMIAKTQAELCQKKEEMRSPGSVGAHLAELQAELRDVNQRLLSLTRQR